MNSLSTLTTEPGYRRLDAFHNFCLSLLAAALWAVEGIPQLLHYLVQLLINLINTPLGHLHPPSVSSPLVSSAPLETAYKVRKYWGYLLVTKIFLAERDDEVLPGEGQDR